MNVFIVHRVSLIIAMISGNFLTVGCLIGISAELITNRAATLVDRIGFFAVLGFCVWAFVFLNYEGVRVSYWTKIDKVGVHQRQWDGYKSIGWKDILSVESREWGFHVTSEAV